MFSIVTTLTTIRIVPLKNMGVSFYMLCRKIVNLGEHAEEDFAPADIQKQIDML